MPTIEGEIVDKKILLELTIWKALREDSTEEEANESRSNMNRYTALLDTGAQISSITQRIVDDLKLVDDGWELITGVHGSENVPMYTVDIAFSTTFSERNLRGELTRSPYARVFWTNPVTLMGINPPDFDVILGMDLLHGIYVTILNDRYTLSI